MVLNVRTQSKFLLQDLDEALGDAIALGFAQQQRIAPRWKSAESPTATKLYLSRRGQVALDWHKKSGNWRKMTGARAEFEQQGHLLLLGAEPRY